MQSPSTFHIVSLIGSPLAEADLLYYRMKTEPDSSWIADVVPIAFAP